MKKFLAVLLSAVSVFAFAACSGDPSDEPGGGKDMTLAENYDFGDPSTWAGTSLQRLNLGDAEFDVFPEDHFYDWGQSVMYDSQEGIYKMWWCRQSRYDSIWYAESEDMKHWHSLEKVLVVEPGQDTEWIKMHVGKPSVIKVEKEGGGYEYRMYFEAPRTLKQGGRVEYDNNVFLATSDDGKDWEIWSNGGDEPYPVIAMTEADLAASEAQSAATGDSYGFYGLGQPSVTQKDGVFYLYYTHSLHMSPKVRTAFILPITPRSSRALAAASSTTRCSKSSCSRTPIRATPVIRACTIWNRTTGSISPTKILRKARRTRSFPSARARCAAIPTL